MSPVCYVTAYVSEFGFLCISQIEFGFLVISQIQAQQQLQLETSTLHVQPAKTVPDRTKNSQRDAINNITKIHITNELQNRINQPSNKVSAKPKFYRLN